MSLERVKKDSHGIYIKHYGDVYRPQVSVWTHAAFVNMNITSRYKLGDIVNALQMRNSPHLKVGEGPTNPMTEVWHSHGLYRRGEISERCWMPYAASSAKDVVAVLTTEAVQ